MLVILDGRGVGSDPTISAIDQANKPFFDSLMVKHPHATLIAHGEAVGLPAGQMGNSEVGHMHIGAGRRIYQELLKISKNFEDGTIYENTVFMDMIAYAKEHNKPVHLMGLLSDGGVHSHIDHIIAMIEACKKEGIQQVFVHAWMDGRDTDPISGKGFIEQLLDHSDGTTQLASVVGRYYAMDRDNRWERVKEAYDLLVEGKGEPTSTILETIQARYNLWETDEFLKPIVCIENGAPVATIQEWDAVICMNFRSDRVREITKALTQSEIPEYNMKPLPLQYVCMGPYDESFHDVDVLFPKENIDDTLGEIIAKAGKTQLRIAETEKYPHVTFFFTGGKEQQLEGEDRILIPSPKVATYDLQPQMSAPLLSEKLVAYMGEKQPDLIVCNYANADMVGHTGVFEAAQKAIEAVDAWLAKIIPVAQQAGYEIIIIADHGNAELMKNPDGSPNTQHSTNPVPFLFITTDEKVSIRDGALTDIAPTILARMGIAKPEVMTGESLVG